MLKILIKRPTDSTSVIINENAVASIEIIKQLKVPGSADPDKYSLVLRGTGSVSWVVAADKSTPAELKALTDKRNDIWKQIEKITRKDLAADAPAVIMIDGEDLPEIKFKPNP